MPYAAINAEIKTILSAVPGIGIVHSRERWTNDKTKLKAMFAMEDKINGWQITRRATAESRLPGEATRTYTFLIRGYYSFEDNDVDGSASEVIIQNLVEAICDAFRSNPSLNLSCENSGPMQVDAVEPLLFSGYLVHHIQFSLAVLEQFQVTF